MDASEFESPEELLAFIARVGDKLMASGQSESAAVLSDLQTVAFTSSSEWLGELGRAVRQIERESSIDADISHDFARIMREVNRVWPSL